MWASNTKRKYVPTPASKKHLEDKLRVSLAEMKETINTLKTLASDTSSKEILDFLKQEN